nr:MAG TPA: hypothetical protein [Caudoviricetes sp.]
MPFRNHRQHISFEGGKTRCSQPPVNWTPSTLSSAPLEQTP